MRKAQATNDLQEVNRWSKEALRKLGRNESVKNVEPCARSGTRPRRPDPCPSTRVLSASNVVGRTRAKCATISLSNGRGSTRPVGITLALQNISTDQVLLRGKSHRKADVGDQHSDEDQHSDDSVTCTGLVEQPCLSSQVVKASYEQAFVNLTPSGTHRLISAVCLRTAVTETDPAIWNMNITSAFPSSAGICYFTFSCEVMARFGSCGAVLTKHRYQICKRGGAR